MEELLDIQLGDLEEIAKASHTAKFDYPVIYLGNTIYFNAACAPFLHEAVKWFTTAEYVIGLPAKRNSHNAFSLQTAASSGETTEARTATFPAKMAKEKKLQRGYYKLYKYKDGFAFKRYEQLDPSAA